ncbi:MAG: arginine--tRNA ligase, partial [Alphaproteobacteria bacterium RIFOXYD12_FULL_60_8]
MPSGLDLTRPTCEPPKDPAHGDVATNAAMVLCKDAGMPPRALADLLVEHLRGLYEVSEASVAGPGFINLRLTPSFWRARLRDVLEAGNRYGYADLGQGTKVNVEYVSANPTGPMHVGHARGAVFGDVLASLMEKMGYEVTREYYLNDAGAQVQALARSVFHRYRQALGVITEADYEALKASGQVEYGGDYLLPVAALIKEEDGPAWLDKSESEWMPYFRQTAVNEMVALIKADLAALGVEHAVFTSELHDLIEAGKVQAAFDHLVERGLIYEGVLEPPK